MSIEVVVVLPLAPATATRRESAIVLASACERCSTRRPAARAATSSMLDSRIAEEITTVSLPSTYAASWPTWTSAPSAARAASTGDCFASEPLTEQPRASMTRATPDMPAPPMAMKWIDPSSSSGGIGAVKSKRSLEPFIVAPLHRPQVISRRPRPPCRRAARRRRAPPSRPRRRPWRRGVRGRTPAGTSTAVDPGRGQRRVLDEEPATRGDDVGGVEALLAVADGQRHVDRGEAHGGQLADRVGTGARDHEVGRGIGEVHAVGVGRDDVGGARDHRWGPRTPCPPR